MKTSSRLSLQIKAAATPDAGRWAGAVGAEAGNANWPPNNRGALAQTDFEGFLKRGGSQSLAGLGAAYPRKRSAAAKTF
jgi:hypothetical protein